MEGRIRHLRAQLVAPPDGETVEELVLLQQLHVRSLDADLNLQTIATLVSPIGGQSRKHQTEILYTIYGVSNVFRWMIVKFEKKD